MEKTVVKLFRPVYPSPAALIVSADENGKSNIMTAAEVFNVGMGDPAIIGISIRKATYTHGLISKTREFTVNLPTAVILEKVDLVGTVSGRGGLDKFAEFGLTAVPSLEVKPPVIMECPVNIECRLLSITEAGSHDLVLGEVASVRVDSDKLDEKNCVIVEKLDGILFANQKYYRFGGELRQFGFSRRNG